MLYLNQEKKIKAKKQNENLIHRFLFDELRILYSDWLLK